MTLPYNPRTLSVCTICELPFTEPSYGGPDICAACDTGFTGATLIKAQAAEIERLRTALADMTSDYLRRHKDACDRFMEVTALREQLRLAVAGEICERCLAGVWDRAKAAGTVKVTKP